MPFDPDSGLHLPAPDPHRLQREQRLRELGLDGGPREEFDRFARELAEELGTPYAMVNIITDRQQVFIGLHAPGPEQQARMEAGTTSPPVGRTMHREHGYCPEVLQRGTPLILPDVCDHPRFSSNPVVDRIGIRTYIGAPLIDPDTGIALGTVCGVGTEPRDGDGRAEWQLIKEHRDRLMPLITRQHRRH